MKDLIKGGAIYIIGYALVFSVALGLSFFVSKKTERVTVINPEDGVKCVVVSRTFNTSVDCWQE